MPNRQMIAKELAEIFKVIAHPDRIRLIEELRTEEQDVNTLGQMLGLPSARISQHLSLLKLHKLVNERRDGRHHYYSLSQPTFASWIVDALDFVEARNSSISKSRIHSVRKLWGDQEASS